MRREGDRYGSHRVLKPAGVLPQAAECLDNSLPLYSNEILIQVDRLNLDSASFHEISQSASGDLTAMTRRIAEILVKRGKMHNPVTNSGGTLLGTVAEVGPKAKALGFKKGDRIVTLVSLTLTPLFLESIHDIDAAHEQIRVTGQAILFESGMAHVLPKDFSEEVALAIFDVCGAPALAKTLIRPGQTVLILGAGKAGMLVAAQAKKQVGKRGKVLVAEKNTQALEAVESLSFVDDVFQADLTQARQCEEIVAKKTKGKMADIVINCVNVPSTEMSSILSAKKSGTVLFFNMATHFQKAVLGAEGIGHETRLVMGNGYYPGHADLALDLVRKTPDLKAWFKKRFS